MAHGKVFSLLFAVNVDELKDMGIECCIGQQYCGAAEYADDIILLCRTSYGLRIMITVCEKYAKLHDVLFNVTKSKILIYNKTDADPHFKVNEIDISSCESCVYLSIFPRCCRRQLTLQSF